MLTEAYRDETLSLARVLEWRKGQLDECAGCQRTHCKQAKFVITCDETFLPMTQKVDRAHPTDFELQNRNLKLTTRENASSKSLPNSIN
ncbi:hypothetical protein TNCV_4007031 [Trichonephila clavipes]|nr:hypothetical protein TNCV_4007031 [Trichonephila clavipes]